MPQVYARFSGWVSRGAFLTGLYRHGSLASFWGKGIWSPLTGSAKYMSGVVLGLAGNSIQLVPDGTLLLHVLLILLMVGILNRTLFQPINKILEKRDTLGRGALDEAMALQASAEKELASYEAALRTARAEGYKNTEAQRREELAKREVELSQLKDQMSEIIKREKSLLEKETGDARAVLLDESQRLAAEIHRRILGSASEPRR